MIGLDAEVAREHWDKVIKLSEKDLYMTEASYCYNLAHAMKGDMSQALFEHSQNGVAGLLISAQEWAGTAAGATIVLCACGFFLLSLVFSGFRRSRKS